MQMQQMLCFPHSQLVRSSDKGFVQNSNIDYRNCGKIASYDLGKFATVSAIIQSACGKVAVLMEAVTPMLGRLQTTAVKEVLKSQTAILSRETIAPAVNNFINPLILTQINDMVEAAEKHLSQFQTEGTQKTKPAANENKEPSNEKLKKQRKNKVKDSTTPGPEKHPSNTPISEKQGTKRYAEPIGPQEPFADDFNRVKAKIDDMSLPEDKKASLKSNAYKAIKELYSMSDEQKAKLADAIKEKYREKSFWEDVHVVNPAQAVVPIVIAVGVTLSPELLVAFTALTAITGIALKNAIDNSQVFAKKVIDNNIAKAKADNNKNKDASQKNQDPNDPKTELAKEIAKTLATEQAKKAYEDLNSVDDEIFGDVHIKPQVKDKIISEHHKTKIKGSTASGYEEHKVELWSKQIKHEVPSHRIDYSREFFNDLEEFLAGTTSLHDDIIKEDLYAANFHDYEAILGERRSLKWATHIKVAKNIITMDDVYEHLGLLKEWGNRDAMTLIKIPKGERATFISGHSMWQESILTNDFKKGGGFQIRFRDFDEKWIVEPPRKIITKKD